MLEDYRKSSEVEVRRALCSEVFREESEHNFNNRNDWRQGGISVKLLRENFGQGPESYVAEYVKYISPADPR